MRKSGFYSAVMLVFCIFYSIGCQVMSNKNREMRIPPVLEPQATLKFSDLPVPANFKLLPQESYSFEAQGVRVAVLRYQGKAQPEQVVNFYKEQMPMHNWNLLNIVEYGERLLNFERDNETCIVSLLNKGNSMRMTISIGPKSQAHKKSERPIK